MNETPSSAQDLCRHCGLCCDGTLFGLVPVEQGEIAAITALGLEIRDVGERRGFSQPCPKFAASGCGVYDHRPATCRKYACVTLRAMDAGEIAMEEAVRRVEAAQAAIARIIEAAPGSATLGAARAHWQSDAEKRTADPAAARFHFLLTALELHLDRHFRRKDQRTVNFMTAD